MNRLGASSSPYLIQHRDNPVDWWAWSDAAFEEAKRLNRPVLLSIGYAACHWCHVMAHESFEDEGVAAVMNELFVCIKVDREERPDVDHLYMSALHALGEPGGWPLTMFLTPDREPFWGGTYFPKTARYGKPGFPDLLRQVATIYQREPDRVSHNANVLKAALAERAIASGAEPTQSEFLDAARKAASAFDPINGGITGAPKFPNPAILNMLWRAGAHDPALRTPVLTTLTKMARGGIHDHLGGGFARYSVDAEWLAPHFEKMLYDNAQLLELYALAADATGERIYREAAEGIVAWLEREMLVDDSNFSGAESNPGGMNPGETSFGFASSLDADSEGEEGRFYVWKPAELHAVLNPDEAALFAFAYDITEAGNFEGRNIPNQLHGRHVSESDARRLKGIAERLLVKRNQRPRPGRDDKVLADWNGLMIAALAHAASLLGRPEWLALARRAYGFVRESMTRDGTLAHSWRGRIGVWPAFSLDYATMALAALALAEATGEPALLADAKADLDRLAEDYSVRESVVLAMNADQGETLIVRLRPTHDDAVPNANGVYCEALLRYAVMAMDDAARARADALIQSLSDSMRRQALAHASLWSALDLRINAAQIVLAGEDANALHAAALAVPYPNRIVVRFADGVSPPPKHPARAMLDVAIDQARAFVCVGERCSLPIAAPGEIAARVAEMRGAA